MKPNLITSRRGVPRSEGLARLGLATLLVALVIAAVDARATVVVMHPMDVMTRKADVVVHARVSGQEVIRDAEGRILTLTEIEVVDGLKGAKYGDVLTIYQVGGVLDGVTAKIAGMHEYFLGEELILFAMHHGDRVVSYGVGVGKFQVQYDGSLAKVVEDLSDIVAVERGPKGELLYVPPTPRNADRLDDFKDRVRAFVREDAGPRAKAFKPRLVAPRVMQGELQVKGRR